MANGTRQCVIHVFYSPRLLLNTFSSALTRSMAPDTSSGPLVSSPTVFRLPPSLSLLTTHLRLLQCLPREHPVLIAHLAHAPGTHSAYRASARRAVVRNLLSSAVSMSARASPPPPLPLTSSPPHASKKQCLAAAVRASPFQRLAPARGSFRTNTWPDSKKPLRVSLR
jgi:hypothetical protein